MDIAYLRELFLEVQVVLGRADFARADALAARRSFPPADRAVGDAITVRLERDAALEVGVQRQRRRASLPVQVSTRLAQVRRQRT